MSDEALAEVWMTGTRPAHLDRCDLCADRAVEWSRWLEDVRTTGIEAADAAFPPDRLAVQQAQILRKLEQLDQPSRVIAFPGPPRQAPWESAVRGVAPAWVGIAAAAGLVLGVVGGQMSARLGPATAAPVQVAAIAPPAQERVVTSDADLLETDFSQLHYGASDTSEAFQQMKLNVSDTRPASSKRNNK
jgi:hypothetical protein